MAIQFETFPVPPLGCNCSILSDEASREAIVVDPGGSIPKIIEYLKSKDLSLKYIIHTHAHFDHCMGTSSLHKTLNGKVCLHKGDMFLYENLAQQCQAFGVRYEKEEMVSVTHFLEDNEVLKIGEEKLEVLHTPGHTPGSVCFVGESIEKPVLFSGDTLFAGSIGRTDLWGGNYQQIIKSIENRLFTLDEATLVIPGHGELSDIFKEKRYNPFFS
jgi:glyoxylase-like metal-dependent hydrolase (beta-lactamase superfamily II)